MLRAHPGIAWIMTVLLLSFLFLQDTVQAQWTSTDGINGGLVFDVNNGPTGNMYAYLEEQGVLKSEDGGSTWTLLGTNGLPPAAFGSAIETMEGTLLAGIRSEGIFRSTDGGESWAVSNTGLERFSFSSVEKFHRRPDSTMYFTSGFIGIFKSEDDGLSWIELTGDLPNEVVEEVAFDTLGFPLVAHIEGIFKNEGEGWKNISANNFIELNAVAVDQQGTIYAGRFGQTGGGVFASIDGGASWSFSGDNSSLTDAIRALFAHSSGAVFAGTEKSGIYRTLDQGATWEEVNNGMQSRFIRRLEENAEGDLVVATAAGMYRSTDLGDSWEKMNTGIRSTIVEDIYIGQDGYMYAATWNGVFRSADQGVTWEEIQDGLVSTIFRKVRQSTDGTLFTGSARSGLFRSVNNGDTWELLWDVPNSQFRGLDITPNGTLFAGYDSEGVYRSLDNGASWEGLNRDIDFISSFVVDEEGVIFAANEFVSTVHRSFDNGDSWDTVLNLTERELSRGVSDLLITSEGTLIAGVYQGAIFRSTDQGVTWEQAEIGIESGNIESLVQSPSGDLIVGTRNGTFFSNGTGGIYRSSDDGKTWLNVTGKIDNSDFRAIAVDSAGTLFGGVRFGQGIYRATVPGTPTLMSPEDGVVGSAANPVFTWSETPATSLYRIQVASDASFETIVEEAERFVTNAIFAPLMSGAMYYWRVQAVGPAADSPWSEVNSFMAGSPVSTDSEDLLPDVYRLLPNYPNPFQDRTTIRFSLSEDGHVKLIVYDLLSRPVHVAVDQILSAGWHDAVVDASELPSGTYFYRLQAGDFSSVHSMVVVR